MWEEPLDKWKEEDGELNQFSNTRKIEKGFWEDKCEFQLENYVKKEDGLAIKTPSVSPNKRKLESRASKSTIDVNNNDEQRQIKVQI